MRCFHYLRFMATRIYNNELLYKDSPATFVIQTMAMIDKALEGASDDPHRHNYYTLIWPFTDAGRHIIDFRDYDLAADQLFFVSPGQVHQVLVEGHPEGLVIQFTCGFLEKYSIREDFISNLRLFRTSDETPPLPVSGKMKERLKMYADSMLEAFQTNGEMRLDAIGAWLKLFLIECNTHCSLNPDPNPQSAEVGRSLLTGFKNAVEKHYQRWHQVKDYAETLNVTPGYLNEVIRNSIGQSAKDYIQNRLVLEARRFRLFTKMSAKEIGFNLGFEDPAHFSKFYKSHTGQSLQEFMVVNK